MADRDQYLKVRRPHDECLLCAASLPPTGHHPSTLDLSDKEDALRRDFCPACWEKAASTQYFSFWVTKRINAPTAAERRLARSERNEGLWRLFAALHSSGGEEYTAQLFLLAHLLMRYRVMVFKGTSPDSDLLFESNINGEVYRITDIPVDSVEFSGVMKTVEEQAVKIMESGDDDVAEEPKGE